MKIRAFQAWRPADGLAEKIASPPYDVVNTAEARAQAEGNPHSFFHVTRPEIDGPPDAEPGADAGYAQAAANWKRFRDQGWLAQESAPSLYAYRLTMHHRSQTGLVAVCAVSDYEAGTIRKHENTRAKPEADRRRHIAATRAQTGPVFLAYRDSAGADALMSAATAGRPLYDFTAPDGVHHVVWRIADPAPWVEAFGQVPVAYIADGHHRAAGAWRVAQETRERTGRADTEAEWFQAVLFPASQLRILPYNRVIKDLNGLSLETFLGEVKKRFAVRAGAAPQPHQPGHASLYLGGRWYSLSWTPEDGADPVASLDVSVLQDRLLGPVLGVDDPRTSERLAFVGGIRGPEELVRLVDSRQAAAAFSMFPTPLEAMMAVADAGRVMPPKSTWFEPKLRDGLLVHAID